MQKNEVEISFSVNEKKALDYKYLRGSAIMERYQENRDSEVTERFDERIVKNSIPNKLKTLLICYV